LKATCESVLDEIYGSRACHIRAGLIVGPYDPTNRFTYWPVRIAEGGAVLAPDVPETLVQYVDARDLARWMIKLVDSNVSGPMNATGPAEPTSIGETLTRIAAGYPTTAACTGLMARPSSRKRSSLGESYRSADPVMGRSEKTA
jgi:2'-hydroxyisoflavone reductase